jgi:4-carboxymuconolactone decarboxylase
MQSRKFRVSLLTALLAANAVIGIAILATLQGGPIFAQRVETPRIAPVPEADWTPAQAELLSTYKRDGRLLNIYTTMANHPELAKDWLVFASHVLRRSSLPAREREILILRIGWLCKSEYEWAQHVRIGKEAGLTDQDIKNIMEGPRAAGLSENDRALLQATDELHKDAFISDATWARLDKTYDTRQLMDIVFAVGEYNLVSMALNSFGVQLEEGLEGFPK